MQHYSRVATAVADTTGMADDIVEEGIVGEETVDVETVEETSYEETCFWMEFPPPRRPRILLVWCLCPRVPGVEILHRRLRRVPLMVGIG